MVCVEPDHWKVYIESMCQDDYYEKKHSCGYETRIENSLVILLRERKSLSRINN